MQNGLEIDAQIALTIAGAYFIASNLTGFAWVHNLTKMKWKESTIDALQATALSTLLSLLILPLLVRVITGSTTVFLLLDSVFIITGLPQVWLTKRIVLKTTGFKQLRTFYVWHLCSLGFLYLFFLAWTLFAVTS